MARARIRSPRGAGARNPSTPERGQERGSIQTFSESVEGLALESALWCRYCAGTLEDGSAIAPNDPDWDRLVALSAEAKDRPQAWLEQRTVYGALASNDAFAARFATWLDRLWTDGTAKTLETYLAD